MPRVGVLQVNKAKPFSRQCPGDKRLKLGNRTLIMGVINATPDSFSGDGIYRSDHAIDEAVQKLHRYIGANVDIIDIGGESTRPGAMEISTQEEIVRVVPIVRVISQLHSGPISIDTTKAEVAEQAFAAGANILNDVSGLMKDPRIAEVAYRFDVPVILTHMVFSPQQKNKYIALYKSSSEGFVEQIMRDLELLVIYAINCGIKKEKIILDPGIGFGKTVEQNFAIIKHLSNLKGLGYPILMGLSRKSFIGYTTNTSVDNRLYGSIAAGAVAILNGADILRVHDVAESVQAAQVVDAIKRS